MTTPVPPWRRIDTAGFFTVIEVDLEPGRTMQLPVRTALLDTPAGDAMIRQAIDRVHVTQDQLREGP